VQSVGCMASTLIPITPSVTRRSQGLVLSLGLSLVSALILARACPRLGSGLRLGSKGADPDPGSFPATWACSQGSSYSCMLSPGSASSWSRLPDIILFPFTGPLGFSSLFVREIGGNISVNISDVYNHVTRLEGPIEIAHAAGHLCNYLGMHSEPTSSHS
jgi:hypothetical protein